MMHEQQIVELKRFR